MAVFRVVKLCVSVFNFGKKKMVNGFCRIVIKHQKRVNGLNVIPHINLCIRPFLSWSLKPNVLRYENDFVPSISEDNFNDSSSLQNYMIQV